MNNSSVFVKFDLGDQKMFFPVDRVDRGPFAVEQLFGINLVHHSTANNAIAGENLVTTVAIFHPS